MPCIHLPPLSLFLLTLFFFFFNDTATTEIYTLSLHDALPISPPDATGATFTVFLFGSGNSALAAALVLPVGARAEDRKSTRLNSSYEWISYAVFCLKKKKKKKNKQIDT